MSELQIAIIQTLVLGLAKGGLYALTASGISMIFGVTRHINIAHGTFLAMVMYASLVLFNVFRLDPYISILITAPAMFGVGILVFQFLLRPLLNAYPVMVFMMFFGVMFILENTLLLLFKPDVRSVPTFIDLARIHLGPVVIRTPQVVAFFSSVTICLGIYWMIENTDFGRVIRACASKPNVASLMGINVRRVQMGVFGLGFVLLGIAGPMAIPMWYISPYGGFIFTLFAIMILVMGGMGNFMGALVSAFIIGLAEAFSTLFLGTSLGGAVPFIIFAVILFAKPGGLFRAHGTLESGMGQ